MEKFGYRSRVWATILFVFQSPLNTTKFAKFEKKIKNNREIRTLSSAICHVPFESILGPTRCKGKVSIFDMFSTEKKKNTGGYRRSKHGRLASRIFKMLRSLNRFKI